MYLDLDNECMTPSETIFHDYDAVLQGSGWEVVNNGMMASAPGHPMWMKYAPPTISNSLPSGIHMSGLLEMLKYEAGHKLNRQPWADALY